MQFPQRDLTNQYISTSYESIVPDIYNEFRLVFTGSDMVMFQVIYLPHLWVKSLLHKTKPRLAVPYLFYL